MKSFVSLERCTCGAYQYLMARESKRTWELVLLHVNVRQENGERTEARKTRVVASVKKAALIIHDEVTTSHGRGILWKNPLRTPDQRNEV